MVEENLGGYLFRKTENSKRKKVFFKFFIDKSREPS